MNHFKKLKEEKFNNEEEVHEIFEKNLNTIFPKFIFFYHKYRLFKERNEPGNEPDTIARCPSTRSFVIIEYKNKSGGENPIIQLTGYHQALELEDFYRLKDTWEEHSNNLNGEKLPERLKKEEERKKIVLVCVVPFGYFTKKRDIDFIKANKIILIEYQKYENDVILVSCYFKEQSEHLGWEKDHIVITKMNEKETKEPKAPQVSISSGDTLPFPITEKLKLDEKIEKFLQEITRYVSSSRSDLYKKTFFENSYKGINYYLKRKSIINLELKKDKILLWLRVIEEKDFDLGATREFSLQNERDINRWGREVWWKLYVVKDYETHQNSFQLLDYYLNKYLPAVSVEK
ncbi:hypothetical protein [endosymbiont GvMRE of Glomus versiforme]|uniref:hypothetical protein n=1 Tax=endosymbiont GvMRE of Glomus versiforme TaxID=2039283 RepID=UPI000ED20740|nr:hypothetical protein [endosymbiont GvMRE of Glomus versiforme]RHZ37213.1 hypothetical protein GvMRE_I1g317 [endosymbiont GvMRE of Glomus versiforme]